MTRLSKSLLIDFGVSSSTAESNAKLIRRDGPGAAANAYAKSKTDNYQGTFDDSRLDFCAATYETSGCCGDNTLKLLKHFGRQEHTQQSALHDARQFGLAPEDGLCDGASTL